MTLFEHEFINQANPSNAGQGCFEFAAGDWIMKDDEGSRALAAAEFVAAAGMAGAVGSLRRRWEFYPSCRNHFLQSLSLYLTMRWVA
jgi:hypothetical protein